MTEEELLLQPSAEKDIPIMGHSVAAIFAAVAECTHSTEEHGIIERNVSHLELMLTKEHIANHPSEKSEFYSAITLGKEHLA